MNIEDTQKKIDIVCNNLAEFLKEKNKNYGDSALNAIKVFSKHEPEESICIRLDDKINRIINSKEGLRKNDITDILGYLILLCIKKEWINFKEFID